MNEIAKEALAIIRVVHTGPRLSAHAQKIVPMNAIGASLITDPSAAHKQHL
jgi:hypothetical protein